MTPLEQVAGRLAEVRVAARNGVERTLADDIEWLLGRVAELEAELVRANHFVKLAARHR